MSCKYCNNAELVRCQIRYHNTSPHLSQLQRKQSPDLDFEDNLWHRAVLLREVKQDFDLTWS